MTSKKISFIGLGIMGSRMAANLIKNSINLTVYNRSKEPTEQLKKSGATVADSAKDAVKNQDIIISMLSNPEAVNDLFLGKNGCLSTMNKNSIWIDCSTVNPSFSLRCAHESKKYGIIFIDAPVAGTKPLAQNAELTFFVGAEKPLFEKIEPLLKLMGNKTINVGETTKGSAFKMVVNLMLAQSMTIFSEAVLFGEKMGISSDFLLDTLPNLAVTAPFIKNKTPMIKSGNIELQFPLELMHKDLHLAALTAYEIKQPLYSANLVKEIYAEAVKNGFARRDFSEIFEYLNKNK